MEKEGSSKPQWDEIEWYTLASGLCWSCQFIW